MTCDSPPENNGFLRTRRLRATGAAGVLLAAALLTGCGQDSGDTSTGTATSEAARAVPERTTTPSYSASKSASATAAMTQDQKDRKKLLDSTKITFDKAVTTAEGAVSGGKVVDLDLRGPGKSDDDTDRESASPSASASPSGTASPSGSASASPSGSASASPTSTGASPSDASASPAATGPEWVATVAATDGTEHTVRIDAVSGKVVKSTEDTGQDAEDKSRTAGWVAKAKQTPQQAAKAATDKEKGTVTSLELDENDKNVLVWSVDVVDKSWNETTVDVDAATGSVTAEETDTD
ncbi:PepSY domain-containing protein [Streptomyces sp. P01-B04]|uniref:PepSY domain-containing protein n=1 Tax=Streptomyces poriferorum TaxID=2798799 RepID=UPI001C5DB1AD|nr:PepSY domain-containing protein [Streptomyces poriferorum]MBW5249532.1 PepSY domain-containing protein [Streptomyces poriferorum]MBW5259301.1 PepSY domain-containing protein [Streptomyces poriferorum]